MDITEKAKKYAEGKALNAISSAIEQAYTDGYNDGLQHREKSILDSIVDGVQYVDLKLPSEKMWSSTYIQDKKFQVPKELTYLEASKLNIPSEEDFQELFAYCAVDYYLTKDVKGIQFTGRNGEKIIIPYFKIKEKANSEYVDHFSFWIKDDDDSQNKNNAFNGSKKDGIVGCVTKTFMGYKLPIMLVKEK